MVDHLFEVVFSFVKKLIGSIDGEIFSGFGKSNSQVDEPLVDSPLNGVNLITIGSKVVEHLSVVEINSEFFKITGEIFGLTHPVLEFFVISVFIFVHGENLDLILLTLHHFFVVNESISITVVVLEHPREFPKIVEVIEHHFTGKTSIILSEKEHSWIIVEFSGFLDDWMILSMGEFLVESESSSDVSMSLGAFFNLQEVGEEIVFTVSFSESEKGSRVNLVLSGGDGSIN